MTETLHGDGQTDGAPRRRLVIVESPAKARTIAGYLGPDYVVESSIGHIRDLPSRSADIPAELKKEAWARLGVDVDHDFEPLYVVNPDKKQQVAKLKSALKDADELLLATDEDREGEAIAWHLMEVLKPRVPVRRMVFHEITPQAIRAAVEAPREINRALVDAQETRRILDRLYGYEVSPVLWKKVMPRLSAGRVQSVATRLLVERERARMRFRTADYWDLEATFDTGSDEDPHAFEATLVALDGQRIATGRDFGETGELTADVVRLDGQQAGALATRLADTAFRVRSVEERPYRRSPYPPFMTSTLQQEGSRKLRFPASVTMRLAQRLYENGYITYMRTDSTTLSETALTAARAQARELYGDAYVPDNPRRYERKVKNAQEAHEAIRPAGDRFRTPREVRGELGNDEFRLYELIWQRTVASQMADATGQSVSVRVTGIASAKEDGSSGEEAEFGASGKVITFPGFLRAYVEESDDESEREDRERRLPPLTEGQSLAAAGIEPQSHATNPPARYTEASLVKTLEELGIGRPSTYASIISTILDRGYVFKRGTALVPSFTAFAVIGLLEQHFGRLVDYGFTASMEDDLDSIANGDRERVDWLTRFYFGDASAEGAAAGLKDLVHDRLGEIDAREVNSIPIGTAASDDGGPEQPIVVRVGRYGPYVQKGADGEGSERASVPEDLPPDELTVEKALSLLQKQSDERLLGQDPTTGEPILVRAGRYGPYVTTQPLDGGDARTSSLFKTMAIETVSLDDALRLLSLPRLLGTDPANGEEVTAQNGRYGPYVKRGTESRSLESEEQLFTVSLDAALALLAQPKTRGRRAAAAPLRELGNDPASGAPVTVKEGRFGPYVTDGETNASLRKGDSVEEITIDRAAELLAERRAKGPATPRKRVAKKTAAKKTAAKKTVAEKTTAKKATKKAAPRKKP